LRPLQGTDGAKTAGYRKAALGAAIMIMSLLAWFALPASQSEAAVLEVVHDTARGRIKVENDVLKLEFGYKTETQTRNNQGGGNLYSYVDKRFSARNIVAVWNGGSSETKAYASGAGGIGGTQAYAVPSLSQTGGASYQYALADNARDGRLSSPPEVRRLADGRVQLTFDVVVGNKDWSPAYDWYSVRKVWTISPTGVIKLRHNWRILKTGFFSEPASRHQISTMFTRIGRWGHTWSDDVSGSPGTNSLQNPANRWYTWTPRPSSIQECNAPDGQGGSQDAVHADYNRFYGGVPFEFWFRPDNRGLGFEGLGLYRTGYNAFGGSEGSTANEICHHNRAVVGDGADAYNLGVLAWWGGDGATRDRYKQLTAGTTWQDSYTMDVRASQ